MDPNEDLLDLDYALRNADADLSRGRQHPNDREARRAVESTAEWLAHLERPMGHGPEIDKLFWPVNAQAKILLKRAQQANRNVPAIESDVVAVCQGIVKLRDLLVPLGVEISAILRTRR